jgi:hypothetical protein
MAGFNRNLFLTVLEAAESEAEVQRPLTRLDGHLLSVFYHGHPTCALGVFL